MMTKSLEIMKAIPADASSLPMKAIPADASSLPMKAIPADAIIKILKKSPHYLNTKVQILFQSFSVIN